MDRPEFHRLAEHGLNEAAQYSDLEDPGLGSSFLEELDRCLQSIETHSEAQAASYVLGGPRVTPPRRP